MNKYYKAFGILCCLIYFTSYISRINFGAVVAEIISAEGLSKSAVSVVVMMSSISYGIGQPVSGILGDKLSPVKLIFSGLIITGLCNLLIPCCSSVTAMSVIWFVNGFAQAFMWPPLVKLMSDYLDLEQFSKTSANVSASSSVGTIFIYLVAPLFIRISSWKMVFLFSGITAVIVALLWNFIIPRITKYIKLITVKTDLNPNNKENSAIGDIFRKYGLVLICVAIVVQGALRDGITTWMPMCISEIFHMDAASSILVSVILPIFSIFSFQFSVVIQRKWVKNEVKLASYMYVLCVMLIVMWGMLYSYSVVLSVILSAMVIALIHGTNLMLVCVVPRRFANCGHISLISGLLNACTYIGSAVSTYGIAKISELFGWQTTILTWSGIATIGLLMCLICIPKFRIKQRYK